MFTGGNCDFYASLTVVDKQAVALYGAPTVIWLHYTARQGSTLPGKWFLANLMHGLPLWFCGCSVESLYIRKIHGDDTSFPSPPYPHSHCPHSHSITWNLSSRPSPFQHNIFVPTSFPTSKLWPSYDHRTINKILNYEHWGYELWTCWSNAIMFILQDFKSLHQCQSINKINQKSLQPNQHL